MVTEWHTLNGLNIGLNIHVASVSVSVALLLTCWKWFSKTLVWSLQVQYTFPMKTPAQKGPSMMTRYARIPCRRALHEYYLHFVLSTSPEWVKVAFLIHDFPHTSRLIIIITQSKGIKVCLWIQSIKYDIDKGLSHTTGCHNPTIDL